MSANKVAVVTGATRGLGRETARRLGALGWTVVVTGRRLADAEQAAEALGGSPTFVPMKLDITSSEEARAAAAAVEANFGRLDALVNNAGAIFDDGDFAGVDPDVVLATLANNSVGALRVTQAFLPLLRRNPGGANVVNVSSGMGGLAEMGGGHVGYRLSKTALNALTRILHVEHHAAGIRVNSVCPGWVRTDMGGQHATRSVEEGAGGIVWAATLDNGGPSGGFFRDGQPIAW